MDKNIRIHKLRIPIISLLSKCVFTGLAAICPPFAFVQGSFELLGDIEFEKRVRIAKLIEETINNAFNRAKEDYINSVQNNKRKDKDYMYFIEEIIASFGFLEISEINTDIPEYNYNLTELLDRIQRFDYFINNSLTRNEVKNIIYKFTEIFEKNYYEEVSYNPTLSNYYTIILSIENDKNIKIIKDLSEQTLQSTLGISKKIDEQTESTKRIHKKLDRFVSVLDCCEKAFAELIHGLSFVFVAYIIFLFTQNIFVINRDNIFDYYGIVFLSFSISEFIDKLLIILKYFKFNYNSRKISHLLTSTTIQIIIVVVVLLLFGITDIKLITCSALSKILSETLKHVSENR